MEKIRRIENKDIQIEVLDGEGMALVDEKNDKMHFVNFTGLILWEEINDDFTDEIYKRYCEKVRNTFQIDDEDVVRTSFYDFIDILESNNLIVRY